MAAGAAGAPDDAEAGGGSEDRGVDDCPGAKAGLEGPVGLWMGGRPCWELLASSFTADAAAAARAY